MAATGPRREVIAADSAARWRRAHAADEAAGVVDELVERVVHRAAADDQPEHLAEILHRRGERVGGGVGDESLDGGGEEQAGLGQQRQLVGAGADDEPLPRLAEHPCVVERDRRRSRRRRRRPAAEGDRGVDRHEPQLLLGCGDQPPPAGR